MHSIIIVFGVNIKTLLKVLYFLSVLKIYFMFLHSVKSEGGRYWSSTSVDDLDDVPVPDGIASLRTRVIEFSGRHEPVKWTCRAPLPSGKLCPRKDRYKVSKFCYRLFIMSG